MTGAFGLLGPAPHVGLSFRRLPEGFCRDYRYAALLNNAAAHKARRVLSRRMQRLSRGDHALCINFERRANFVRFYERATDNAGN